MNANARAWGAVFFAALVVSCRLAAQQPQAKDKPPAPPAPPSELQVLSLRVSSAQDVAQVLQSVFGNQRGSSVRVVADPVSNALLVSAPAEDMARIKELVIKLDTPRAERDGGRPRLHVFPLKHLEADKSLDDALRLALQGTTGNYSLDKQRRQLILNAEEPQRAMVDALLAQMDVPPPARLSPDVSVRIVWLASGLADAPAPPDDLKDVLPTLAKLGIDKPRLAATTLVNVTAGSEFQSKGVARLTGPCPFGVTGRVTEKAGAMSLSITIRATVPQVVAVGGPPGAGVPMMPGMGGPVAPETYTLQTEIAAPLGHLVVLGVTPTDTTTSVFVVQILRPETKAAK